MEDLELRILHATAEEFNKNGFKFKMDDVAKNLAISKRTLYETVPSKESLIGLVIDMTFKDVKNQQRKVFNDDSLDTLAKLKKLLTIIPSYSDFIDYRLTEQLKDTYPKQYKKVCKYLESDWDNTLNLYNQAVDEGFVKPANPGLIKLVFTQIFEALINGQGLVECGLSYEDAMSEIMNLAFSGLMVK